MRTKTDKDRKKAASQRLQYNVSLPTVVLDASDCAKLLDGTGKTSVIVVERGGKIVPASSPPPQSASALSSSLPASPQLSSVALTTPFSSPSTSVSARLSSGILAPKSKLCKDPARVPPSNLDNVAGLDGNSYKTDAADERNSSSNYVKESTSSEKGKVILKPPKKRRGNDKGAYEDVTASPLLNGESNHLLVSPLREFPRSNVPDMVKPFVSSSSSSSSSLSFSSSNADSLQKHTIENLLQAQTSTNNNNNSSNSNNNNLISGRISHRPYETISHQPSQTTMPVSSVHTTLSVISSLQTPSPSLSPSSSSTLSTPQQTSTSRSSPGIAYLGSNHQGLPGITGSSLLYSSSSHPLPSQSVETHSHLMAHYAGPSENTELSSGPANLPQPSLTPPPISSAIHRPSFQHLPVQDEPMNLSTSSKMVNGSSPLCEGPLQNEMSGQMPHSHAVESSANVQSSEVNVNSNECVDVWKNSSQTFKENSTRTLLHQDFHSSELEIPNSVASECDRRRETDHGSSRASSISRDQLQPSPSSISPYHSQSPGIPQSAVKTIGETSESYPQSNEESDSSHAVASSSCDIEVPQEKGFVTSPIQAQSPSLQPPVPCAVISPIFDADSGADKPSNLTVCDKETSASTGDTKPASKMADKDAFPKVRKPPKKRIEIPMDKESCANRLARYTGSIDCVITDFVFNPEPADEISLTEEEEAIIRQQFEDNKAGGSVDKNGDVDKRLKSVSKLVDTSDLEKENSENISTALLCSGSAKKDVVSRSDQVLKPPKKRANAIKNAQPKKSSEAILSAVANVESVLASVSADVTNHTPPSEEGLLELNEKYGHLLKKKKKKVDSFDEDETKYYKVTGDKTSSPQKKKVKTVESVNTTGSFRSKVADSVDMNVNVSRSSESKETESKGETTSAPLKEAKPKVKMAKKRKLEPKTPSKIDQGNNVPKSEEAASTEAADGKSSKPKKKKLEGKTKTQKKKKSDKNSESAACEKVAEPPIPQTLDEKDLLSSVKMETSDLGESIASASGGSEQVTPVHEPETKDEGTNTDQGMDKENQDTGAESGSDDREKPVRHYKRRLDFVKCSQCDHQARGRSALSRHMKKIHLVNVDMPYKCTLCTYGCTKMASLNRHLFTHGIFPCSRCNFRTDQRDKLTEHIAEHHKDKLDMKLCKICNRYIKCERVSIEEHSENCQGPTPFKCTECNKEFKYGSSLRVHYHTHFPDEPKRFKCELCDYKTNYKANLHKHHKNMHASKDRDIQCPDCGKMFSTEDNMRRHRKVHTLARPFACETCKKTFKTSGALKGHQLIHTATRPFTCNIPGCNRSFRTPKFLKSHQEEFHRLVPKKFVCQVQGCNYSFFKRSHLKRHAITHTGERNFHCTWPGCSKSFRHADNLKVHFRSHTNEKPVQCHLCDFKCKQKNSLFWHKKKVHQIVDASTLISKRGGVGDAAEVKNEDSASDDMSAGSGTSQSAEDEKVVADASTNISVTDEADDMEAEGGKEGVERMQNAKKRRSDGLKINSNGGSEMTRVKAGGALKEGRDSGPTDLYEFKSDDESEDEGISPLREKIKTTALPPLPPPPKELLLKNEMQEQKEREKHEKAERKEQEKKEKADKKEQEKKEKAEKKETEKKEKAEKKEIEKKEKEERREKEKQEKEEKKLQEKKERIDKKEKEKKERERKSLEVKRLKMEARKILQKGSALKKKRMAAVKLKKEATGANTSKRISGAKVKKVKVVAARRKSPSRGEPTSKPEKPIRKLSRGRKKKSVDEETKSNHEEIQATKVAGIRRKRTMSGKGAPKEEKQAHSPRSSSPRASGRKSPAVQKTSPARSGRTKTVTPPKRKPSARIKANRKASAKKVKFIARKTSKVAANKKKVLGKKSQTRSKQPTTKEKQEEEEEEEGGEEEAEEEEIVEEPEVAEEEVLEEVAEEPEVKEDKKEEPKTEKKTTTKKRSSKPTAIDSTKEDGPAVKETEEQVPSRPVSPAYSEEIMLQGKASPYRDFSDAEDFEEKDVEEKPPSHSPLHSPGEEEVMSKSSNSSLEQPIIEDGDIDSENKIDEEEEERPESCPPEDSSDDEVINDIPLTPPRAPAPPPRMESSEDEMEPELGAAGESCQPFSVPAPNTPFSVPGPNTPFSVPPPTNLMQQHSVHSEEMPMSAAVLSVASMEIPSVEMQQAQGSVEHHPHDSVEHHPHGSVEHHPHGSVDHHPHGSVEHHPHGSVDHHPHGSVEHHPHGSVEHHPHGSVEHHPHGSVDHHPHGSVEHHPHGSVEHHPHGSVEHHPHGSVEHHPHGSVEHHPHGSVEHHPHGSVEHHPHGSVEHHPHGSVEHHSHGSVEHHPHGSVEHHPHGSVEHHPHSSVELHPHSSVELHPHSSVELHPHSSVELHPHGSVELHPHGSVELHPHGSVELHPHGSVELHPHGSVELHPHGSVELHPHGSVELHPHGSGELRPHSSVEMHPNSSVEMNQPHGSVEMQLSHSSISEPMSQSESQIPQSNMSGELPSTPRDDGASAINTHDKYGLPRVLEDEGPASDTDRKCFDRYLKNLSVAHNSMECSPPSGLQQLEAMVDKSHADSRDLMSKSPQLNQHHPAMPTSVITSLEGTLPHIPQADLRARIDPLVERHHELERHHESLYARDTVSALPRLPDRQSATPLLSNHATPAPAFDTFSPLTPLHASSASSRDSSYLRQQESIFATPPVTSSFMAEAMFQRQAMATPFLPPAAQSAERGSLSRISDPASTLRTNNTSSLLRRPTTMPATEMFTSPAVPQTMPRHPFSNVWPGQEVRQTHWQSPYLPRQPNMTHANSPFFPPKENYLTGREFMFDPSSVRSSTERGMFSSLSSSQSQDSFQMDRFDISNYFPNPMTPYGSTPGTLDYTRSTHSAAPKPFDERYRQTAAAAATAAAIPDFRGLPPTTAATEMFPSIGVNSGFNLYPGNPMSYHHPQHHMADNMNSAFLTHSSSAQHAMLERDYAAAAAHRSLYPHHQNATYPFIDERQYSGSSKLTPTHATPAVAAAATQERELMSRSAAPESQMQDPYRSMLYRY